MRVVVDTNVFVSAVLKVNSLPFLAVRWVEQHGRLLKSLETERQLMDVLARPHIAAITTPGFRADLAKLMARAELVDIRERIVACRDPTDDKFLELAVNGRADRIVTGDTDLLVLTRSGASRSSRRRPSCKTPDGKSPRLFRIGARYPAD